MNFLNDKKNCLSKMASIDKSRKGSIDSKIIDLLNIINSNAHNYTTSSCSGRIILQTQPKNGKKYDLEWKFVSHDLINEGTIFNELKQLKSCHDVWFKMESAIIHVACDTIENAQKLVDFASKVGFRRSGIRATNNKIIVEVVGSENIYAIVYKDGIPIITDEYSRILTEEANNKLKKNWKAMEKLKEFFK